MFYPLCLRNLFLSLMLISYASSVVLVDAASSVPSSKIFKFVNQGDLFTNTVVEYKGDFRFVRTISNHPFSLCFYNITANSYTLALGMGTSSPTSRMLWVWSANRGRPVGENAVLSFGRNGNLVLVDTDGLVAWQTRTADKGVVDIKLLPNGNLVLLNSDGGFVWQSFDYPGDTLLNGQGLRPGGAIDHKLVSRLSETDDSPGPYSMVINGEGKSGIPLFYKSKFSSEPLKYDDVLLGFNEERLDNLTFYVNPATSDWGPDYTNQLGLHLQGETNIEGLWAQPKYNSTLSLLRLGWDGNLHVYTYYEKGYWNDAWDETFTYFAVSQGEGFSECRLPEKCGAFGICSKSQCVACPTPKGLTIWSEDCKPPTLPSCKASTGNASYYQIDGVDHFLSVSNEGEGPMKIDDCKLKCSKDCRCAAFFYRKDTSRCLIVNELNTLTKVTGSSSKQHVAFIKYANNGITRAE
ncbi:hypothetical protein MKW94_028589 [Papaver nudicaule]|uniref:Bulb-type lectin domain-containing protein n=1 Tax=Papaver nudicaule TaxID=74823 RepID=A0AA41VE64_PAPNU|nr:hypothetical protein [Papaver nudicaule]